MKNELVDFQKEVIEESFNKPVLVDFWAEWCGPCKMLGPVLEKLADKYKDQWKLVKLNTDLQQDIAVQFGIRGIPNCKLFSKGKVINEFTGALPEKAVEDWLKKSIPSKFADMIEKAEILLKEGKEEDAKIILEEVLKGDINNSDLKVLLSKILVFNSPHEAKRLIENVDLNSDNLELANAIETIVDLLEKLKNKTSLSESAVKNLYLEAISKLHQKDFDNALQKFIQVIREDKSYNEEGARKACIAIFKYLGEDHTITLKHRRDFGSALYV
jgi:putative thioredoxin